MPYIRIKYRCGHVLNEMIHGNRKDSESLIRWKEKRDCPVCWKEKKTVQLPDLQGSEAQIEWAIKIRKAALESADNTLAPQNMFTGDRLSLYKVLKDARNRLETEKSAVWWISNRDIVQQYLKRILESVINQTGNNIAGRTSVDDSKVVKKENP